MFFNPALCDLCKGQFFLLLQTLLAQLPYSHRKQKSLCNHLQSHQNGSYLQIITNVLLIRLVVHTAENFLHVFMFPLCGWYRQQGLKAVYFPCATTLFLGYARKSPFFQIVPHDIAAIRTVTFLQALRSICVIKNCSKSFWQEWNAVIFTVLLTRSHCWSLEDNSSALSFKSARYLIGPERSLCLILCGSAQFKIRKNSRSLGVDGYTWPLRFLPELVNQNQFLIFNVIFMVRASKLATISYFISVSFVMLYSGSILHPSVIIGEWRILPPATSSSMVKRRKPNTVVFGFCSAERNSLTPSKWQLFLVTYINLFLLVRENVIYYLHNACPYSVLLLLLYQYWNIPQWEIIIINE